MKFSIEKIRIFLYVGLGLMLALSVSGALIFGGLLICDWAASSLVSKTKSSGRSRFLVPVVIFFIWGVLVSQLSGSVGLRKSMSVQSAFLLLFLISYCRDAKLIKGLIIGFCVGCGLAALWGILQTFSGINHLPTQQQYVVPEFFRGWPQSLIHELAVRNGRAVGPRSHPLTYAESFIPAFFFLFSLLLMSTQKSQSTKRAEWGYGTLFVLLCCGILLAEGRAVWLGLIGGSFFALRILPKKVYMLFIVFIGLFCVLIVGLNSSFRTRFLSIFLPQSGSVPDQRSRSTRFYLWQDAVEKIKDKPLVGYGLKGVALKIPDPDFGDDRLWSEAHNIFIQVVLERGIVGFGLLIWILIVVFLLLLSLPPPWKWTTLAVFIAYMVAGITESWMRDKEIALIFWAVVGCAEFLSRNPKIEKI